MPIVQIIVALILIGVALYLINLIPMDATIKKVIQILVLVLVVVWVLTLFGLLPSWHAGPYIYHR